MNKKMKKITIILTFLLVIISLAFLLFQEKGDEVPIEDPTDSIVQPFPTRPISDMATDEDLDSMVTDSFKDFVSSDEDFKWWKPVYSNDQMVRVDAFSEAIGAKIDTEYLDLIQVYNWSLFKCDIETGFSSTVLSTRLRLMPSSSENLYQTKIQTLESWEPTIIEDLSPIVYPQHLHSTPVSTIRPFFSVERDSSYDIKQAEILFEDGQVRPITYLSVGDEVLVGGSERCVLNALNEIYDLES